MSERENSVSPKFSPLFVGGASRSGTTFLGHWLFQKGENIAFWPMDFIVGNWPLEAFLRRKKISGEEKKALLSDWLAAPRAKGGYPLSLYRKKLEEMAGSVEHCASFDQVVTEIMELFAREQGRSAWGVKENYLEIFGDQVFAIYPRAFFLISIRDPRASICSELYFGSYPKRNNDPSSNFWFRLSCWGAAVQSALRLKRLFPGQVALVRYETLVKKKNLGEILSPIGVLIEASPPEFSFSSYGKRSGHGVYADSLDKWKDLLKQEEIWAVEMSVGELMLKMDYSSVCSKREFGSNALGVALVRKIVSLAATHPAFSFFLANLLFNPRSTLKVQAKRILRAMRV